MKIAISSVGKNISSKVSETSGRAPYYLIFENGKLLKILKNPFRVGGGGAGFGVVEMLSEENVNLVISGKCGHNMISALTSKDMQHKEISDLTVEEALKKLAFALSELRRSKGGSEGT